MNANPSIFNIPSLAAGHPIASPPGLTLADLLYDGFYMVFLLKNAKGPRNAEDFSTKVIEFLAEFERQAKRHGFSAEDIYDAKYAFCATVDEAILSSRLSICENWQRRPLQLTLFGDQLAGEYFFDKLGTARDQGAARLHVLEVFHMCLLLGFRGKYLIEGPERLGYLTAQLGDQIAHLKGRKASFAPHALRPDSISHELRRNMPLWSICAFAALSALVAFTAIRSHLEHQTRSVMDPYRGVVNAPPRLPHITITLP